MHQLPAAETFGSSIYKIDFSRQNVNPCSHSRENQVACQGSARYVVIVSAPSVTRIPRAWRLFSQCLVLFGNISDRVCVLCSRGLVALEGCEENRARVWRYAMSEGLSCCRQRDSHGY
jgi:hypothetical protein